ncbi:PGF-pre-PGF domain-containing protein [Methanolobus zinderi]|uniref:PGF-pre-PGF domain-containing protein n=1 Tax=Methanolobus zinderi TaxID=536044 RepID=A0A7D5E744_9EURY|nr:PGF-pre-PGF domain-containing protein [Methanolobus zinderi]QLC49418.1 PGF-pre-PGF domain-containing protein [Methanolobus zinderi]
MYTKRTLFFLILVFLMIFTASCSDNENISLADNSGNHIFLKTTTINTDKLAEEDGQEVAVSSNSIEEAIDVTEQYYIAQFRGPVFEDQKEELGQTGAVLYDYLPDNAFIVRMNASVIPEVSSLNFVKWIGEYRASYKYEPAITVTANKLTSESEVEKADLLVMVFDASENSRIDEEITEIQGTVTENSNNILRIKIPKSRIDELAAINGVSWIEEYREPVLLNDIAAGIVGVTPVHDTHGLNGSGQIVAVCDTGVDTGVDDESMHADIRGRILDFVYLSDDGAADMHGHGTHVVGSILGNGAESGGQYKGMAPEASLVFLEFLNSNGTLSVPYYINQSVFQPAYDLGAKMHSNSWGYTGEYGNYTIFSKQVDQFMWENPDMLILFAAGNYGVDQDDDGIVDQNSIQDPATAKNCIAVGSSENNRSSFINTWGDSYGFPIDVDKRADNIEGIAATSSRGPTTDGRIKPDLIAPGTYIVSVKSSQASINSWYLNENYAPMSGTSMATPIVAGSAALIRQYYSDTEGFSNPSAALIKATLINGAHDMTPGQYGTEEYQEIEGRPDYSQGWGRIDLENSLFPRYPEVIAYFDKETISDTDDFWEFDYGYIEEGEPLRATLVWTDYPGSEAAGKVLVNNLDLTITDSFDTYYGNYDLNNAPDTANNVEGVEIDETIAGDYKIRVDGTNVPEGPQDFSLVLSFTCDNNEFPANGSSTDDSSTVVSTNVVHPGGVDRSSIQMMINDSTVDFTAVEIDGGYRISYSTPTAYQNGDYNVSVNAQTISRQEFSYNWEFNMNASPVTNHAPVLDTIGDQTVDELTELTFTATANDSDLPENTLTFSLSGTVPNGAAITSDGVLTWTPTESQGPDSYTFDVEVSDGSLTDSETITVTVKEVNVAPVLDSIGDQTIDELTELTFTATATDSDIPENTLTFSLSGTVPNSAAITSDGVFTWTPTESQRPDSYTFDVEVSDGSLTDSETITVTVYEDNAPPEFDSISPKIIEVTKNLQFFINATDIDSNDLTYSNESILPDGATFNDTSLLFNWTPTTDQKGTYDINFSVTDGEKSDNQTVTITVKELSASTTPATSISSGSSGGGGGGGTTGEEYENIEIKDVNSLFVGKDKVARFEFDNPDLDIMYVEYTSLKNAGTISVTIESLKDKSTFVHTLPSGEIYRNMNIWVGKTGYAIDANIADPVIAFRVDKSWINEEDIDDDSISLNRYSDGSWSRLATEIVDSDEDFLYFEAETPGFSPFAITGIKIQDEAKLADGSETLYSTPENGDNDSVLEGEVTVNETEAERTLDALSGPISLLLICLACLLIRKK